MRASGERSAAGGALPAPQRPPLFMHSGSRPGQGQLGGRPRPGAGAGACVSSGPEAERVFVSFRSSRKKPETSKKRTEKKTPGDGGWASLPSRACTWWGGGGGRGVRGWSRVCHPALPGGASAPGRTASHWGGGAPGRSEPSFVSWGRKRADVDRDRPAGSSRACQVPPSPELRK